MKRIKEATRYKRETGLTLPRWQDQIIKYEKEGGYFIHFSIVPRMNLYIVNKYNTPIGFYAYALDKSKIENFAADRPYAIIFKPKSEARILELKTYSETDLKKDIDKLVEMGYPLETIEKAEKEARVKSPGGKIWNITRFLSGSAGIQNRERTRGGGETGKWSVLLKKLGYDGVNDDCLRVIDVQESCQAVFFDTTKLDLVKIVDLKGAKIKFHTDLFDVESRELKTALKVSKLGKGTKDLVNHKSKEVRRNLATKTTDPEILRLLADDTVDDVVWDVAENLKTPPDVLRDIANNTHRRHLGGVRQAAKDTLEKLNLNLEEALIMEKLLWKLLKR
jgi:hypothetical protein